MRPSLVFIRHGETDWNAAARFQGQKDIPLNDKGRGQAKRNGTVLRDLIHADDYDFVASPLSRTRETMEIIRQAMGLEPKAYRLDERLREISFGEWEGHRAKELEVNEPDIWQTREDNRWNFRPKGGENYPDLCARIGAWFEELSQPTVVVSHGGVNRALRSLLGEEELPSLARSVIPQDQMMVLEGDTYKWV